MSDQPGPASSCFVIPADHPALPGHFPGNPTVPGVLLLAQVLRVLEASGESPARLRSLKHAKFIEPLPPGQEAVVTYAYDGATLAFSVTGNGRVIMKGSFAVHGVIGQ